MFVETMRMRFLIRSMETMGIWMMMSLSEDEVENEVRERQKFPSCGS